MNQIVVWIGLSKFINQICRACIRSPGYAGDPSSAMGAVPETEMIFPILTAREKPIGFSKGEPDDIFCLVIIQNTIHE
jgi:hypothetical protein